MPLMRTTSFAWLTLALLALACGSSDTPMEGDPCGPGGTCPTGFMCNPVDNRCYRMLVSDARPADARAPDATPDAASPDAARDAAADAGVLDTTITSGPEARTGLTTATFTFTGTPAGVTFECRLDTGELATCESPRTYSGLAPGDHTFSVRARDGAAVDTSPASRTWTVVEGPAAVITGGPAEGGVSGPRGTFTYTTSPLDPAATFECAFDTPSFSACAASGFPFSGLAHGSQHTFQVRAVSGGVAGSADSRMFTVDAQGPVVTIATPAEDAIVRTTFGSTFSADEPNVSFSCMVGAMSLSCTSPETFTLAPGDYTLTVRGTDAVGNEGPPATRDFTVAPPAVVEISFPTQGGTTGPDGTILYSTEDAVSVTCELNDVPVPCELGGYPFSDLEEREHSFSVTGIDAAGAEGNTATVSWTVDATGPVVLANPPFDPRSDTQVCPSGALSFQCADEDCPAAEYFCSIDFDTFETCAEDGYPFAGLQDGGHVFNVYGVDEFGNEGPVDEIAFNVDGAPPDTTIVSPAGGAPASGASGEIVLSSLGPTTRVVSCTVDGTQNCCADSSCSADELAYSGLSEANNPHTIVIELVDGCGNATTIQGTFTVDTTPPVINAITVEDPQDDGDLVFNVDLDDDSRITQVFWRLDADAAFTEFTVAAPSTMLEVALPGAGVDRELSAGLHTFRVYAVDEWGNSALVEQPTPSQTLPTMHAEVVATKTYGPNLGHLVVFGHDLAEAPPATLRDLVGNAVNLVPFQQNGLTFDREIKVVGFEGAGVTAGERDNVLNAIQARLGALGQSWTRANDYAALTGTSATALGDALVGRDVLIIFDQNSNYTTMQTRGAAWRTRLTAFLDAGGVVVLFDGMQAGGQVPSQTVSLLGPTGARLLGASAEAATVVPFAPSTSVGHPLLDGITSFDYNAPSVPIVLDEDDMDQGQPTIVYATTCTPGTEFCGRNQGWPSGVVIDKIFPVYTLRALPVGAGSGALQPCERPTSDVRFDLSVTPASGTGFPGGDATYECELINAQGGSVTHTGTCAPGNRVDFGAQTAIDQFLFWLTDGFGNLGRKLILPVDFGLPVRIGTHGYCRGNQTCPTGYECDTDSRECLQPTSKPFGATFGFSIDRSLLPQWPTADMGLTFECRFYSRGENLPSFTACPCAFPYQSCSVVDPRPSTTNCSLGEVLEVRVTNGCGSQTQSFSFGTPRPACPR
jgi:hypothetical protein